MSLIVKIEKKLDHMTLCADFSVNREVLSLFGASGSGKSMLLKCIAGLETPDKGRIVLNDRVLFDSEKGINLKPQQRRAGYVFQNYALFPNMTVEQNIGFAVPKREQKQVVSEMIKKFRLEGLENVMPARLSGGQKQRVSIARMFAAKPELVMLDEPFSALDHSLVKELIYEMKTVLENTACPVLFVSHNREEVYALSNRLGIMENGCLGSVRLTKEIFQKPQTIEEAKLCGYDNRIRLTHEVKKMFGIDGISADVAAVGIYADDIDFQSTSNTAIELNGRVISMVEEINQIRYEVMINGASPYHLIVNKRKERIGREDSNKVGAEVDLFIPSGAVHLLKNGGKQ